MSNLLSNANLYDSLGEFTFVAPPKELTVSLVVREPTHKARFANQSFSYVQGTLPMYASNVVLNIQMVLTTVSASNAIRSSAHSVVVI